METLVTLPLSVRDFLAKQHFADALAAIRQNTSSEDAFRKRFFRWFDGFRAMKFVHHARDCFYGDGMVEEQAARLLAILNCRESREKDPSGLLKIYRGLDRLRGAG